MLMIARQLLSIAILPFTVTVLVPLWIARGEEVAMRAPSGAIEWMSVIVGALLLALGLALFSTSLRRFAADGAGTLAPWDPPRKFVVTGPCRFLRNPMISGVILILLAESAILRSRPHLWWALIFFAGNLIQIPLMEEPMLRARFGAPYDEYCRNVGRLIPRFTPWTPRDG